MIVIGGWVALVGCQDRWTSPIDAQDGLARYDEGSAESSLIVRAANELTLDELHVDVGLTQRTAQRLVGARSGPDGLDRTADDTPFATLAAVDAVTGIGGASLDALLAFARTLWPDDVHGIQEGSADALAILDVANRAAHGVLEIWVHLGLDESTAIYDGRSGPDGLDGTADDTPFPSLLALDQADGVDGADFQALLAWARCPADHIVSSDGWKGFVDLAEADEQSADGTVLDICAGTFEVDYVGSSGLTLRGRGVGITTLLLTGLGINGLDWIMEGMTIDGRGWLGLEKYLSVSHGTSLTVRDAEFVGFDTPYGAIYAGGGQLTLEDVLFEGNSAYDGGAIYCNYFTTLTMTDVTFRDNEAVYGGALFLDGTTVLAERVTFDGNRATTAGGAIYTMPYSVATPEQQTLIDSVFIDNEAPRGGGIWTDGVDLSLQGVDFGERRFENDLFDVESNIYNYEYDFGADTWAECDWRRCR